MSALTTGVRNPSRRNAPHPVTTRHVKSSATRLPPLESQIKPCAEAIAPTTTRINNSAVPGLPPGNVENSLCSLGLPDNPTQQCCVRLLGGRRGGNPTSRYLFITLSGYGYHMNSVT